MVVRSCASRWHCRVCNAQPERWTRRSVSFSIDPPAALRCHWLCHSSVLQGPSHPRRFFRASPALYSVQYSTGAHPSGGRGNDFPTEAKAASASTSTPSSSSSLLLLSKADMFAQSRIANYVKRLLEFSVASGKANGSASGSAKGLRTPFAAALSCPMTEEERHQYAPSLSTLAAEPLWVSSLQVPADVLVKGTLCRVHVSAVGIAGDEKMAYVAACMHAERCLDALSVPLFTSAQRQHQRVVQAMQEGRSAPEVDAQPAEFSHTQLPAPVCITAVKGARLVPLPSYQPTPTVPRVEKRGVAGPGGSCGPVRRRSLQNFTPRYATDPFLSVTLGEMFWSCSC